MKTEEDIKIYEAGRGDDLNHALEKYFKESRNRKEECNEIFIP
jgi:hypothetical protein